MNGKKELRRTREGRVVAGVCAGAGRYLGIDPNLLRVGVAIGTLFSMGMGVAAYIIAWVLIPEEDQQTSIAQDLVDKAQESETVQDAVRRGKDAVNRARGPRDSDAGGR